MCEKRSRLPVNDGHLFFEAAGEGDPVVFLHGFGLDSRMWSPQVSAFQPQFRTITYDLRGFGRSSIPAAYEYAHEDDLNALLSHLGAAPAHVVGLSMGGRMALRFAAAYPKSVRSLVLADSALDGQSWSADWQTRWSAMCQCSKAGQLATARRQWLEHPLFDLARANPSSLPLLASMVEDYSGWHWSNKDTARVPSPPLAERLGEIRVPALVIIGERDIPDFQAVANILAEGLPDVRRTTIKNAGHMVNLEASQKFNAALTSFWQDK
jgi:pimeloyl-ACP methyl ester carboxylesterase